MSGYIAKTFTETRKLSPCPINLTETRVNSDQIKVLEAELTAKHWVAPISITHDGMRYFKLQSDMSLLSGCDGSFTEVEDAYAAIVDHLSTGGIKKYGYQLALKVEDMLTKEQELDLKEASAGPLVSWQDYFRLGRAYITEARLSDGSAMAKLEVRDAGTDSPMLFTVDKKLSESLYRYQGDEVPEKLLGSFTGVRSAASALSSYLSQEGI